MALDKNDWKKLDGKFSEQDKKWDKRFEKFGKGIIGQVNKLLTAQTIRLVGQNVELEQKFEKKVDDVKSEIFTRVDPILKEVQTKREHRTIVANKLTDHTDRIEKLENIHPKNKHDFATS